MTLCLVCVDCLRQDVLASDTSDTPFLDEVAADGFSCSEMHATATTTTPAVASTMTGRYSEHNGVYSLRDVALEESVTTLAERLSAEGYETRAYVTGPLLPDTQLDRGFDEYGHRGSNEETVFSDWFETLLGDLDDLDGESFVYVHLWELHHPISVPDGFDSPEYGRIEYERTLSALDRKLEQIEERLPDDSTFALMGDHGESLSIRNRPIIKGVKMLRDRVRFGHGVDTRRVERAVNSRFSGIVDGLADHLLEDGHGQSVYDFTTNVPFRLVGDEVPATTVDEQVRQVDIFPTILDLLDIEPNAEIDGESLLSETGVSPRPAYIRGCGESLRGEENWIRAVRMDGYKFIEYPGRNWPPECYDLEADPLELSPLDDEQYDDEEFRAVYPEATSQRAQIDIDDHLRDLGYL